MTAFMGQSWPGECVWLDFMNEGAHKFWRSLYQTDYFTGTNSLYGAWIDMNEPSVRAFEDNTMPKTAFHVLGDSWKVLHRDTHNVYGHMMAKATYEALIERDKKDHLRPFVLTRSAFLGTQKYAAKWTGDNLASYNELYISISQLLSLSIAGLPFVGADIPGFYGKPTDELYILFY